MSGKLIYVMCFVLVLGTTIGVVNADITAGLVAHWQLDSDAKDSAGNNHGTLESGASIVADAQRGNVLSLDGVDDYVNIPDSTDFDITGDFTVAFWIKLPNTFDSSSTTSLPPIGKFGSNDYQMVFTLVGPGYTYGFPPEFPDRIPSHGAMSFKLEDKSDGNSWLYAYTSRTSWEADTWYHVTGVYIDADVTGYIYVDGELQGSAETLDSTSVVLERVGGDVELGRTTLEQTDGSVYYFDGRIDDVRIYSRALTQEEIEHISRRSNASRPSPANEATDVPRDVVMNWAPGQFAPALNGHIVYLSESFNDVNDGIDGIAQSTGSHDPGGLKFETTYYWRVDEVNAPPDSTVYPGEVWSFTTEPYALPIENITATASSSDPGAGPENTVNSSGLNENDEHSRDDTAMWLSTADGPQPVWIQFDFDRVYKLHQMLVWNYNIAFEELLDFGFKEVSVEYSENGTEWAALGDVEFAQGPGQDGYASNALIDLGGVMTRYIRLTAKSNWSGENPQFGLSEVRFLYIPVQAREPDPDSGATDVDLDVTLSWRAGREAAEHKVYLSTDEQAVIDGTDPVTTVTEASYSPSESLILDSTYYWRVDEVNNAETPTTWQGDLWSLSTQESLVVDDFEDYGDYPPDEVWSTWVDGYGNPLNGSNVGYPAPNWIAGEHYVETTTVHGGNQSAPFLYDNTTASYSEGERTFDVPQDWTKGGAETLVLWFYGDSDNAATEQMYVKINDVKVLYPGDAADITRPIWKQWNIDLAALGIDLSNVTQMSIGFERAGGNGGAGMVLIDDIILYRSAPPVPLEEIWIEAEDADTIGTLIQVLDNPAASGDKYIAVEPGNNSTGAPDLPDGVATWAFTVAGGTYKIRIRLTTEFDNSNYDSCWVRIQGAEINKNIHSSGWIRHNDAQPRGGTWGWDDLHSSEDDASLPVYFTLAPGTHTLEWAYREDGLFLDAIQISNVVE